MRTAPLFFMLLSLSLAHPAEAGKLYFNDTATVKLQRANRQGGNLEDLVVSPTTTAPIGMTIDTVNSKI